jgi:hypothetical protein
MARPKLPKKKIKKSVTLNEATIKTLTKLGAGNLSLGIELIFQKFIEEKAAVKE